MWINSRGLTIAVDDDSPLSVSINDPQVNNDESFLRVILVIINDPQVENDDDFGDNAGDDCYRDDNCCPKWSDDYI